MWPVIIVWGLAGSPLPSSILMDTMMVSSGCCFKVLVDHRRLHCGGGGSSSSSKRRRRRRRRQNRGNPHG